MEIKCKCLNCGKDYLLPADYKLNKIKNPGDKLAHQIQFCSYSCHVSYFTKKGMSKMTEEEKQEMISKWKQSIGSKTEEERQSISSKISEGCKKYFQEHPEVVEKKNNTLRDVWNNKSSKELEEFSQKMSEIQLSKTLNNNPVLELLRDEDKLRDFISKNKDKNLEEISEELGVVHSTLSKYLSYFDLKDKIAYNKSTLENILIDKIKELKPELKIIRNDRTQLNGKELDIFIPELKVAIEVNGILWHSSKYKDSNYHLEKTEKCKELGIQLIHIWDSEYWNNEELVIDLIRSKLNLNKRIYARNCIVKELSNDITQEFLSKNHMQGSCVSKVNLGVFSNEDLVAVMTFGKPRYNTKYEWELLRFCSLNGYNIVGGASKLLSYFNKKFNPKSLITYANKRWSNGNLYEKLGFKKLYETKPCRYYYKDSKIYHRSTFQKWKLKDKLEVFDEKLTELDNMELNGYLILYDCGNIVYELNTY